MHFTEDSYTAGLLAGSCCIAVTLETEERLREYKCVCVSVHMAAFAPLLVFLTTSAPLSVDVSTDQNECKDFGSAVCGTWRCENTIGSYRCFMGCQPGLEGEDNTDCGEWSNRT